MNGAVWWSCIAIAVAAGSGPALRAAASRWSGGTQGMTRARGVAALRLGLVSFALLGVVAELVATTSSMSHALHWASWSIAAVGVLACLANSLAGLWLLSPFVNASPGDALVTCGLRGRIVDYGLLCLKLETEPGWSAHLLYIAVAARPLLVSKRSRVRETEFLLERQDWTEEAFRCLRQAAVLAPYRDVTAPVTCSRCAERVSVRLSLSHPAAEEQMRALLDATLRRYESQTSLHEASDRVTLEPPSD